MNMEVKFSEDSQSFEAGMGDVQKVKTGEGNATFIPRVSDDGTLSWTNDAGFPNPKPVNIKGPNGGYYAPEVTQPEAGKMVINYTASQDGMPPVEPKSIDLPAGPPGDEYKLTPEDRQAIAELAAEMVKVPSGGGSNVIPRVEMSDKVATIEPNVFYVFPEMDLLYITFGGEPNTAIVQEYKFRFTSGATPTTLMLPNNVIGDIVVPANSVVELSIIDGFAVCQTWGVSV